MLLHLNMFALGEPWRWQAHIEVWMVVAGVVFLGWYVARVIGPKIVPEGEPTVPKKNIIWFCFGVVILWVASDWPMHDIAEQYLYMVHMVQHLLLTFLLPPVFWLSVPEWLARLVVTTGGRFWAVLQRLARPVVAGVLFNVLVVATHWSWIVNTSIRVGIFHYLVHTLLVFSAFLMWLPVCGPWKELRMTPPGQAIYLFLQSIVPTVPGAWITMAETPVYSAYNHEPRIWGISVLQDQQVAGLIMKLAGGIYLWVLITWIFFKWASTFMREDRLRADEQRLQRTHT